MCFVYLLDKVYFVDLGFVGGVVGFVLFDRFWCRFGLVILR